MLFGGPKVDFVVFVFGSKHDLWRWVDWLVLFFLARLLEGVVQMDGMVRI